MAEFILSADRKMTPVNPSLGVQYDDGIGVIRITTPLIVAGVDISGAPGLIILEDFPMLPAAKDDNGDSYTYSVTLNSEYTQKAGSLSIQLVLTIGEQIIRSELGYGQMARSQSISDLPSVLYPSIIIEAREVVQAGVSAWGKFSGVGETLPIVKLEDPLVGLDHSLQLDDLAVTESKLGAGAVTSAAIKAGAVTSTAIGAGAVTSEKLEAGVVTIPKTNFSYHQIY